LNAGEALADLCTGRERRRCLPPVDGLGGLDEGFFQSNRVKLFTPIGRVAFDENVLHADLDGIHAQTLGDFVHLLFASPSALRNTIAAIRAGDRFVGVYGKAVDLYMRDAIWAGRGQAAADTHGRALFRIRSGAPVDSHLPSNEGPVFLHAALAI